MWKRGAPPQEATFIRLPTLSLICCVTAGKSLALSESPFFLRTKWGNVSGPFSSAGLSQHSAFTNVLCQLQSMRQMFLSSLSKSGWGVGILLVFLATLQCQGWPCRHGQSPKARAFEALAIYPESHSLKVSVCGAHRILPFDGRKVSIGLFILPLAQAQGLEIIFDSSFSHTPCPISQPILLASPSKQVQNLMASHHLLCPHLWPMPLSSSI